MTMEDEDEKTAQLAKKSLFGVESSARNAVLTPKR
jgi:hypothetical protein